MNYGVNEKSGFTLPETCVALAVFLAGMAGILGCWNFFNREVADERYRLERFYDVLSTMESLIAERPLCVDSLVVMNPAVENSEKMNMATVDSEAVTARFIAPLHRPVTVRLNRVLWSGKLAWAVAEQDEFTLTRLVRCR
jgi:hypothetical protein